MPVFQSNDFLREIWLPRTYIGVGGYTRDDALGQCEKTGELIAFARSFISNVSTTYALYTIYLGLNDLHHTARPASSSCQEPAAHQG